MQRLVTCYYALALLALNGRLYEESERCLARAERLDKRLRSGIMETRRNDGSHYTKDEHGRFTGSTSAGGSGGSGGNSSGGGADSEQGGSSASSASGETLSESDKRARHLYDKMTKEERAEVIQRGQNEPKAVFSYDRADNKAMSYLQKVPKEPDTFDVMSHGTPDRMEFFRQDYPSGDRRADIDAYTLSCILKGRSDYKAFAADCQQRGVTPTVRLLSCNTGSTTNTGDCFAQLLANELGHNVSAPDKALIAYPGGKTKVGRYGDGKMVTFFSRKN